MEIVTQLNLTWNQIRLFFSYKNEEEDDEMHTHSIELAQEADDIKRKLNEDDVRKLIVFLQSALDKKVNWDAQRGISVPVDTEGQKS